MRAAIAIMVAACWTWAAPAQERSAPAPGKDSPEARALAFLSREVPRWSRENKCFSCHNNGDAARALIRASQLSDHMPDKALSDTTEWLQRPERWDRNGGDAAYSDKGLARLQFAAALLAALDAGLVRDRAALRKAAELGAEGQQKDGSWQPDAAGELGSPATYGVCLATFQACRVLRAADPERYREPLARAHGWLVQRPVRNVLDAAAILLALDGKEDKDSAAQRERCLDLLRKGQSKDGGWGPYVTSPPEPFDTAVVLLALVRQPDGSVWKTAIRRGRNYLIAAQQADGSWKETTRPAGAVSYAQRLSTAGWATLALLDTTSFSDAAEKRDASPQRRYRSGPKYCPQASVGWHAFAAYPSPTRW